MIKNVYSIHDEEGRITQSNQVFDDDGGKYGRILAAHDLRFLNHAGAFYADLAKDFIWNGELCNRPRPTMRCGHIHLRVGEGTYIHGIPLGAHVSIVTGEGYNMFDGPLNGRTIDFDSPVPGTFTVTVRKFPMREWTQTIVVEA